MDNSEVKKTTWNRRKILTALGICLGGLIVLRRLFSPANRHSTDTESAQSSSKTKLSNKVADHWHTLKEG